MYEHLPRGLKSTFSNIEALLKINQTILKSNTSSVLKRLKTYLQNSIG